MCHTVELLVFRGSAAVYHLEHTVEGGKTGKARLHSNVCNGILTLQQHHLRSLYTAAVKEVDECGVAVLLEYP